MGVKHEGKVYLGGDSAGTDDWLNQSTRVQPKVFVIEEMALGFTHSFRMGQLLQHMELPPHPQYIDDFAYMVTLFIPAVKKLFTEGGFNKQDMGVDQGGFFFAGYRGHLYCIQSDYQVSESADDYDSIGCGGAYACGALHTNGILSPKERIIQAIGTAEYHSAGVRGPINIVETGIPRKDKPDWNSGWRKYIPAFTIKRKV